MNTVFKSVWNKKTGAWVAVSEITKTPHQGTASASSAALLPQRSALPTLSRIAQQLRRCFKTPMSVLLSFSLLAPMAQSANAQWIGAASDDWFEAPNWVGGVVPAGSGNSVAINNMAPGGTPVHYDVNAVGRDQMELDALFIANTAGAEASLLITDSPPAQL